MTNAPNSLMLIFTLPFFTRHAGRELMQMQKLKRIEEVFKKPKQHEKKKDSFSIDADVRAATTSLGRLGPISAMTWLVGRWKIYIVCTSVDPIQ